MTIPINRAPGERAYPHDCPGFDNNPAWMDLRSRVSLVEQSIERIEGAIDRIAESMENLVRLEERQGETRKALIDAVNDGKALDKRLVAIETALPGLIEIRKWVVGAVLGGVGLMLVALAGLVIHAPK